MIELDDDEAIDRLRAILDRRSIKLTDLSKETGIPYRTLQNYMYKKAKMPLASGAAICRWLGITVEYLFCGKYEFDFHALKDAVTNTLGELLDEIDCDFDSGMSLSKRVMPITDTKVHRNRIAGTIAVFIQGNYDRGMEYQAWNGPEEDTEDQ